MFIDTHCHLNFKAFESDWREAVDRAVEAGLGKMVVVGANLASSERAVELTQLHPALYAAVGVHPHHVREFSMTNFQFSINELMSQLQNLAKQPRVVAIGEIGLDYHIPKNSKYPAELLPITEEFKDLQRELFTKQLELAQDLKLPVILHSREAKEEVLEMVKPWNIRGTFHCFGGSKKYLKRIIEAGFYVGFDGDITYVEERAMVAKEVPLERLLLETDSPYLTPIPYRGKQNEPANIQLIAQSQADSRGITIEEVTNKTTENAIDLFNL